MSRIIHFEIEAAEPERAMTFYTGVFGWKFHEWEGGSVDYWLIQTGPADQPGIDGGLARRQGDPPAAAVAVNGYSCVAQVTDLDAALARITAHGGVVTEPKHPVPGIGWAAYAKDTEGNLFGMMQPDPNAR